MSLKASNSAQAEVLGVQQHCLLSVCRLGHLGSKVNRLLASPLKTSRRAPLPSAGRSGTAFEGSSGLALREPSLGLCLFPRPQSCETARWVSLGQTCELLALPAGHCNEMVPVTEVKRDEA